jgi:Ca2+-binding EF-hand superfamily protein
MSEISEEKLRELQAIFDDCDNDNNGRIDWDEFGCVLDKLLGEKNTGRKDPGL